MAFIFRSVLHLSSDVGYSRPQIKTDQLSGNDFHSLASLFLDVHDVIKCYL